MISWEYNQLLCRLHTVDDENNLKEVLFTSLTFRSGGSLEHGQNVTISTDEHSFRVFIPCVRHKLPQHGARMLIDEGPGHFVELPAHIKLDRFRHDFSAAAVVVVWVCAALLKIFTLSEISRTVDE